MAWHAGSGGGAGGRVQIHRDADEVAACAGLDFAGPNGASRHFQATLVHVLFAAAMIAVGAGDADLSAVVAAENGQRVFVLPVLLERVDDATDTVVHVLDECHQPGALVTDAWFARLHLFEPILRRLNRRVWCVVSEVHEERGFFALAAVHMVDAPLGNQVGGVAGRVDLTAVFAEIIDTVPTVLVVVVDHVAEETLEMIETAPVRCVWLLKAKVPFADDGRMITGSLECPGQERGFR